MKPILCFLSKFRHDLPTACAPRLSRADAEMAVGYLARGRMWNTGLRDPRHYKIKKNKGKHQQLIFLFIILFSFFIGSSSWIMSSIVCCRHCDPCGAPNHPIGRPWVGSWTDCSIGTALQLNFPTKRQDTDFFPAPFVKKSSNMLFPEQTHFLDFLGVAGCPRPTSMVTTTIPHFRPEVLPLLFGSPCAGDEAQAEESGYIKGSNGDWTWYNGTIIHVYIYI